MEKWTWCWNSLQAVSWACSKWKLDVLQTGEASETSNPSKWQEHFRQPKWHNMLQHFVVIHSFRISKLALHIVHNETDRLGPSYWLRYGFFSLFVESLSESCFLPGFATCRKVIPGPFPSCPGDYACTGTGHPWWNGLGYGALVQTAGHYIWSKYPVEQEEWIWFFSWCSHRMSMHISNIC